MDDFSIASVIVLMSVTFLMEPSKAVLIKSGKSQTYYEAIDVVAEEVKRRFDQPDICIIRDIENVLLQCANEGSTDLLTEQIVEFLGSDVHVERLKFQLARYIYLGLKRL